MKTYLRYLELSNFRSFLGTHRKELPKTGLVLVSAKNFDTGGSSGGGKSTVSLAINAAFGLGPFAFSDNQNWDTEEPARIVLGMETEDGLPVELIRGPKNVLRIGDAYPGDGRVVTGSKDISAGLEKLVGMPLDILETLTFLPQGASNDFLTKTNGEKQAFLATVLNLGPFETAVSVAQKNLNLLENKLIGLQAQAVALDQEHLRLKQALQEPFALQTEELDKVMVEAAAQLVEQNGLRQKCGEKLEAAKLLAPIRSPEQTALKAELDSLNGLLQFAETKVESAKLLQVGPSDTEVELQNYRSAAESRLKTTKAADQKRELEIKVQRQKLEQEIQNCRVHLAQEPEILKKQNQNIRDLRILRDSTCPTCSQAWLEAQDQIPVLEKENLTLGDRLELLKEERLKLSLLQQELTTVNFVPDETIKQWQDVLADLNTRINVEEQTRRQTKEVQLAQARAEAAELEKKAAVVKSQIKTLSDAAQKVVSDEVSRASLDYAEAQVLEGKAQAALSLAKSNLKKATDEHAWKMESYRKAVLAVTEACQRADAKTAEAKEVEVEVAAEKDFIKLVGREGFLGTIFDEVLAEISAETNQILARVANTSHVTLQFVSESETKKGVINREIKPVVTVNGHVANMKAGLSGGMYTAVRLAVRLALGNVIGRRTGSFPCWQCIDEQFDGLDSVSKEACFAILSEAAKENLILVVDHSSEFKELFTETIALEYQNGKTKFAEEA